jgi:hypothetical protein
MEVIAIPQTPNRIMSKKFNKLYSINQALNGVIAKQYINTNKIEVLQIFFDTEVPKDGKVEFLKFRDGILQIVIPFDWGEFQTFDEKIQKEKFIQSIHKALEEVLLKYKIDSNPFDNAFNEFYSKLEIGGL